MYDTLSDSSRVWIYQSSRPFSSEEEADLKGLLENFAQRWVSHNQQLLAHALIKHHQFIILMVDESQAGASGCSIDKSVHFLKQLEERYEIDLFDRMTFAFEYNGAIKTANREEFTQMYQQGELSDETLVFNNLVKNKAELDHGWKIPLGRSWHKRLIR